MPGLVSRARRERVSCLPAGLHDREGFASVAVADAPGRAPAFEHRVDLSGDEEARAVAIIALVQEAVVIREHVADVGHEGEPGCRLGRCPAQAGMAAQMVAHRRELVRRHARREPAERLRDGLRSVLTWHGGLTKVRPMFSQTRAEGEPPRTMAPLSELKPEAARRIAAVLTDIDDTITTDGRLPAAAYAALERLHESGLRVVPVTGRPAGWCDLIARFWPVDGVVGENGAFSFRYDHGAKTMHRRFFAGEAERADNRRRLDALAQTILAAVPGAALAADQPYRIADLAIDVCEDVPPLPQSAVDTILRLFAEAGATAKLSSIHVNGWFGTYDKLAMARRLLDAELGIDAERAPGRVLFIGDSPNDEPMFRAFPVSVGVANIRRVAARMSHLPAYVTRGEGGAGFVELAEHLLAARAQASAA